MKKIFLPDLFYNFRIIREFVRLYKLFPEYFYQDREIVGVYGSFPKSVWALDRDVVSCNKKIINSILNFYKNNNLSVEYLFINPLITKESLNDNFSNYCLTLLDTENDSIILSSKLLESYVNNKFSKLKIKKFNYINKCFISEFGKQMYFLNPICNGCTSFKHHLFYVANEQIRNKMLSSNYNCMLKPSISFYDTMSNPYFISNEKLDLFDSTVNDVFYISTTFFLRYLKRNYSSFDFIEAFLYYLVKPEFVETLRSSIIKTLLKERKFK